MQKYFNTIVSDSGAALSGALVRVTQDSGIVASIYSDNGVTPASNPLVADAFGYFEFYAADGTYTLTISHNGAVTKTITGVTLGLGAVDPATAAARDAAIAAQNAINARFYPGTYAADPTTRPDGTAIQAGDRYFNSTISRQKTYSGTIWATDNLDSAALAASSGSGLVGFLQSGTGSVPRSSQDKMRDVVHAKDFGVTGGSDDTAAMNKAITAAGASLSRTLILPPGVINVTGLQVSFGGLHMIGSFQARGDGASGAGTQLTFTGTSGALIQLGTDDGQLWSASLYNGPQGLMLENMNLMCNSPNRTTPLALAGNYAVGCYGIRDWRGGDVKLRNVTLEGFEYNFWGVNSDFNTFYGITSLYSKYGIYAGPKSDQFTIHDLYSFNCDHAVTVDGAGGVWIERPKFVICGSTTEAPVLIRRGSGLVVIRDPWYENFSGLTNQLSMVQAGTEDGYNGNTAFTTGTVIENPTIGGGTSPSASCLYLVVLGNARNVVINNPVAGNGLSVTSNLSFLAAFAAGIDHGSSNSSLIVRATGPWEPKVFTNLGTGTASVFYETANSANQFGSSSGRLIINRIGGATGAESLRISTENAPGQITINAPTYSTGQTNRLQLRRSVQSAANQPSSGTFEAGDFCLNQSPSVLGTAGSKYVVLGWMRLTTGSAHVANTDWVECRTLTGT